MEDGNPSLPPVAQATEEARKARVSYESALELHGTDHATTKFLRDQLDKELAKAGTTAQLKNLKQISDQKLAISKHGDAVTEDHNRLRSIEQKYLDHLESELVAQKAYMAQMEVNFKNRSDLVAKALQRTVEMEQQIRALEEEGQPAQDGAAGPPPSTQLPGLPTEIVIPTIPMELIQSLQAFVATISTMPDVPQAAKDQVTQLQTTLDTHLTPGVPTPATPGAEATPATPGTYGPAAAPPAAAARVAPYARQDEHD